MAVNPTLPVVGGSTGTWGAIVNAAIQALDGGKSDSGHTHTASYSLLPAGTVLVVDWTSGSAPARPTSRTDVVVRWRGPSMPAGALAGDEYVATA